MSYLRLARCAVVVILASSAFAADFYVDVVNGNDANPGTSPGSAWRTLTHASAAAPAGSAHTIHVAPGTYSPATGESFPLMFREQRLVGDQGPASTILDGGGGGPLIRMHLPRGNGLPSSASLVQGFTLRNTSLAVELTSDWLTLTTSLVDCVIQSATTGIDITAAGVGPGGNMVAATLTRVTIEGGTNCVDVGVTRPSSLTAIDCTFRGAADSGIKVTSFGTMQLNFIRSRFETNAVAGVWGHVSNFGRIESTFSDCLLARNGAGFTATPPSGLGAFVGADFHRSTVADNAGAGVILSSGSGVSSSASFRGTLVHGNSPDVSVANVTANQFSQIGGPDPQFVDRGNGDFRLRFGSPSIDMGDPGLVVGVLDLARVARPIDGDLDTNERADIGAFEHQPLRLVTSGSIGSPLRLEMSGPAGGTTTVYFTRGPLVAPASTPFGQFDLNPATFGTLFQSPVAPFPPVPFQRPIPNQAVLIGRTFAFQGLTSSGIAPNGFAYTNAVSFTVVP